jgi:hypothetical protein
MSRTRSLPRRPAPRPKTVPSISISSRQRELTTKRRGELAELAFTLKAASLGFGVAKPYGDSERYDFILDARDLTKVCHPEERALCATKDLGGPREPGPQHAWFWRDGPRDASRSLPGTNARSARILCPPTPPALLWRVQVKCSTHLLDGLYRINAHRRTHGRAVPYLPSEIDFLVAYIIPEDTWYVIPVRAIRGTSLLFRRRRDRRPGLYDQYREAWRLLRPPPYISPM